MHGTVAVPFELELPGQVPARLSSRARANAPSSIVKPQAASSQHRKSAAVSCKAEAAAKAMSGHVPHSGRGDNSNNDDDSRQHQPGE